MKDELTEFREWQKRVNEELDSWSTKLSTIACETSKNYRQAITWLSKQRPSTPLSFRATAIETFNSAVISSVLNQAIDEVKTKALNQAIKKEVKNND